MLKSTPGTSILSLFGKVNRDSEIAMLLLVFFVFIAGGSIAIGVLKYDRQILGTTLSVMSQTLKAPVLFNDESEIRKTTLPLKEIAVMDFIGVQLASGQVIEVIGSEDQLEAVGASWFSDYAEFPITDDGKRIGAIMVQVNRKWFWLSLGIAGFATGLGLLVIVVRNRIQSMRVSRLLNSRINKLMNFVQSVQHGQGINLQFLKVEWPEPHILEVQTLYNKLIQMLDIIEKRDRALAELNQGLESKVEERTRELEAQRANQLESARLASLGEMAGGIAHEINNPLAVISLTADRLKTQMKKPDFDKEVVLKGLSRIESYVMRITSIIRGLRTLARDGNSDAPEPVSLSLVINDVLTLSKEKFQVGGINLQIAAIPESAVIRGKTVQISQVILNLLNNAHDAVQALPEDAEKWIRVEFHEVSNFCQIRITDSGNPIPNDVKEKIMRPFFTTKAPGKGTGLGLSISKSIVEQHGGTLLLDSAQTETSFVFKLPKAG